MKWLKDVADNLIATYKEGDITVSSGVTPSGKYHLGTLREILTAEAIRREIEMRGRAGKHIHVVDDFDVFRKVPVDIGQQFEEHLGKPLFLVPSPDGSSNSYADFFLKDLHKLVSQLKLDVDIVRAHEKYQEGMYQAPIEKTLQNLEEVTQILTDVSGHKLDDNWSPIQVMDGDYLKTRKFKSIDTEQGFIEYVDQDGKSQRAGYVDGHVKLNWRIDWPARWWLLGVQAEPFGRDHATKGGSYDTGKIIAQKIFSYNAPLPVPYHFVNRAGETKKISKSAGNVITVSDLLEVMPPEIIWYFMLRYSPSKQLFFDEGSSLVKLFDDFAILQAKKSKTSDEQHLLDLCLYKIDKPIVSQVPFSHLVASYQAALRDTDKTLEILERSEYKDASREQEDIIRNELVFIGNWLNKFAPPDIKFDVQQSVPQIVLSDQQIKLLDGMAEVISASAGEHDGQWYHQKIYEQKELYGLSPAEAFQAIYRVILNQDNGPQAGWFLATLEKDWLINRLQRKA